MRICCGLGEEARSELCEAFVDGTCVPKSDRVARVKRGAVCGCGTASRRRIAQRPDACAPRSTIQVEDARATSTPEEFVISHSVRPTVARASSTCMVLRG